MVYFQYRSFEYTWEARYLIILIFPGRSAERICDSLVSSTLSAGVVYRLQFVKNPPKKWKRLQFVKNRQKNKQRVEKARIPIMYKGTSLVNTL